MIEISDVKKDTYECDINTKSKEIYVSRCHIKYFVINNDNKYVEITLSNSEIDYLNINSKKVIFMSGNGAPKILELFNAKYVEFDGSFVPSTLILPKCKYIKFMNRCTFPEMIDLTGCTSLEGIDSYCNPTLGNIQPLKIKLPPQLITNKLPIKKYEIIN